MSSISGWIKKLPADQKPISAPRSTKIMEIPKTPPHLYQVYMYLYVCRKVGGGVWAGQITATPPQQQQAEQRGGFIPPPPFVPIKNWVRPQQRTVTVPEKPILLSGVPL